MSYKVMSRRNVPAHRAFTIIELLVVISIISLLVAILLPSLAAARGKARQVQCLAQQKQYHLGMTAYAHDNQGWYGLNRYSRPWQLFDDRARAKNWEYYLGGTNKNIMRLLACPDTSPMYVHSGAYAAGYVNGDFINTSYFLPGTRGTYPENGTSNNYFGWQGAWENSTPDRISAPVPNERFVGGTFKGYTATRTIGPATRQPMIIDGYGPSGFWGNSGMSQHFNSHTSSTNMVYVDGHGEMRNNDELLHRHRGMYW